MRPVKILIRLRECAGWSESWLSANFRRYVFCRWGSFDGAETQNILWQESVCTESTDYKTIMCQNKLFCFSTLECLTIASGDPQSHMNFIVVYIRARVRYTCQIQALSPCGCFPCLHCISLPRWISGKQSFEVQGNLFLFLFVCLLCIVIYFHMESPWWVSVAHSQSMYVERELISEQSLVGILWIAKCLNFI